MVYNKKIKTSWIFGAVKMTFLSFCLALKRRRCRAFDFPEYLSPEFMVIGRIAFVNMRLQVRVATLLAGYRFSWKREWGKHATVNSSLADTPLLRTLANADKIRIPIYSISKRDVIVIFILSMCKISYLLHFSETLKLALYLLLSLPPLLCLYLAAFSKN